MRERTPVQLAAAAAAAAFLAAGLLGLVPGITTHYGRLRFAGHGSGAELVGVFRTSVLLDLVHLAFGVAGLALARTAAGARAFLVGGGGIASLVVWVLGPLDLGAWVPLDTADNWLHLLLGIGLLGLAAWTART